MEGNASVYQVYAVSRITSEERAECSKGWGGGLRGGCGGEGISNSFRYRTIDPRIPTMPRRSTSGFNRPGRHRLHQARSTLTSSVNRVKGELLPTKNRLVGRTTALSCIWMTASRINLVVFWCGRFQRQHRGMLCNCLVGDLHYAHCVIS